MRQLAVTGVRQLELQEVDEPVAQPGCVVVRVAYCGICGSDMPRYFDGGVHEFPQVLGHEFSGTVERVGPDVASVEAGDRVAVAPLVPAPITDERLAAHPSLRSGYSFIGSRQQGALADLVEAPARNLVKVPESVSLRNAALIEPMTVALHGLNRLTITPSDSCLVYGAGVIGNLTVQALRARGVRHVTVSEPDDYRAKLVVGSAPEGFVTRINPLEEPVLAAIPADERPTVVVETSGNRAVQSECIEVAANAGQIVYVGTAHGAVELESDRFERILRGELIVTGAWMSYSEPFPGSEWSEAVRLLESGAVNVEPLISKEYTLEDGAQPFLDLVNPERHVMKALYRVDPCLR